MSTSRLASHLSPQSTPQSSPLPGQVPNHAGGFAYAVDDFTRLDRFLILGSEGGTYYVGERKLTIENAACVTRCMKSDFKRTLARIVEISDAGRALKNDPALMALAILAQTADLSEHRRAAMTELPRVARIGTDLFHFVAYMEALGGWGRAKKRGIADWYLNQDPHNLALQLVKYQQRDGWSHLDLIRLALHISPKRSKEVAEGPNPSSVDRLLHYVVNGWDSVGETPHSDRDLQLVWAFERAKQLDTPTDKKQVRLLCDLIETYRMPHECVPNEFKSLPVVWEAMLPSMGAKAMIRNLGKMTSIDLLKPLSAASRKVVDTLSDVEALRRGRLHPLSILVAQKIYAQGHGDKGDLSWKPVPTIVDALDGAFYSAFKAVEPTGKRHYLGIDVSGSMDGSRIAGSPLTAREAAAAMALVTANVEPDHCIFGFAAVRGHWQNGTVMVDLNISARSRLDTVIQKMAAIDLGRTDCALPMLHAMEEKLEVDAFVIYTDNETWAGKVHPSEALKQYRRKMGIASKSVVVATSATSISVADPKDAGSMDVVGFDTATPAVLADFVRG